jgi:hypothetical protein
VTERGSENRNEKVTLLPTAGSQSSDVKKNVSLTPKKKNKGKKGKKNTLVAVVNIKKWRRGK